MSLLLEILSVNGNIDLTKYLDVEAGKGMEPGDPSFTEKIWARSLLKTGASLALENLREKEQVFPLKLKAPTKEALAELVQEINTILNSPGAQVKWRDEGATIPTFFDLLSGQFDEEFNYWRGVNNWLEGKLRLFSQPLGYSNQLGARRVMVSGVATAIKVATSPIIVFNASGVMDGDASSLPMLQVRCPTETALLYAAMSILPDSGYIPFISAASMNSHEMFSGSAIFTADIKAPGGTFIRYTGKSPESLAEWSWRAPSEGSQYSYVGEQRILVVARVPTTGNATPVWTERYNVHANGAYANATISSTQFFPGTTGWEIFDFGVYTNASANLRYGGAESYDLHFLARLGSQALDVAGIIQLPENTTCWVNAHAPNGSFQTLFGPIIFDGVANKIISGASMGVPASGVGPAFQSTTFDISAEARGAIPLIPAGASPPIIAALYVSPLPDAGMNLKLEAALNVLERTRYVF